MVQGGASKCHLVKNDAEARAVGNADGAILDNETAVGDQRVLTDGVEAEGKFRSAEGLAGADGGTELGGGGGLELRSDGKPATIEQDGPCLRDGCDFARR